MQYNLSQVRSQLKNVNLYLFETLAITKQIGEALIVIKTYYATYKYQFKEVSIVY